MLRPLAVSAYVDILSKVAEDFVQKYQDGGTIEDLRPVLVNYATESNDIIYIKSSTNNLREYGTWNISEIHNIIA